MLSRRPARTRPGATQPGHEPAVQSAPLRRSTIDHARQLVAERPVANVHAASLIEQLAQGRRIPHGFWLLGDARGPVAIAQTRRGVSFAIRDGHAGTDPSVVSALARIVARSVKGSEVVYGEEGLVRAVLDAARSSGIKALEIRRQELMAARVLVPPPGEPPHPAFTLRPALRDDLPWLLDAHAAMCLEDLGVDQVARNRAGYEEYFVTLIRAGRSQIGELNGSPVFKAEFPVESEQARLVEGVYTDPRARRLGLAGWAMRRAIADAALEGRTACLYVHRRNAAARRVYDRAGFRTVCPWLTALVSSRSPRVQAPAEY